MQGEDGLADLVVRAATIGGDVEEKDLIGPRQTCQISLPGALVAAIALWADARTDASSPRRRDLLRDKRRAVERFFAWVGKPPAQVIPLDVKNWQATLEAEGLAPATVYAMSSRLSSFYEWAMADPDLQAEIWHNPVRLARPRAPRAYRAEGTRSLDDDEVKALLAVVRARAEEGHLAARRDYALLLFYLATGLRRREVIGLRWGDLKAGEEGRLVLTTQVKGGEIVNREVDDPRVSAALEAYLVASGRRAGMGAGDPLWTRHDRAGAPGAPLTGHAFARNLKRYAQQAGLGDVHIHQLRHTFARLVSENTGSLLETQEALGHKNLDTTRVYVRRVAVQRDRYSRAILDRLGVEG